MHAEIAQRWIHPKGVIEVLRLPTGALTYRSSAAGYAIYSATPEQAEQALAYLLGNP